MRPLLTIFFLLKIALSLGQGFTYPTIKNNGHNVFDFIPNGWKLLDSASGELNNDRYTDLAFVIEHIDSVSLVKSDETYLDTVITQPRILILAFYNSKSNQYDLVQQSNTFILNHDNPSMEEPFQAISISVGILKIDFSIFMNAGSWGMSNNAYKFRYQDNQFHLIGADYFYTNRGSGETENRSYNFVTKKVKISTGTISNDKQKIVWRVFELKEMKTLETFIKPFTWEVEKGYYL
jgi:hypothetical protein